MKILSRGFNLVLAVIIIHLFLQNIMITNKLAEITSQPQSPAPTTTANNSPSWQDPDLQEPYPEIIPPSVVSLIEAFRPQEGHYNQKLINQVADEINDRDLRDLLSSIAWQSKDGQALTAKLIALELLDPQQLPHLPSMDFKDLTLFRRCLLEPDCYELFEKCVLNIKCCILRYPCRWPCKACYLCWYHCCSTSIQIGMIGEPPVYKTVKKVKFQTGSTFSVQIDASDSSLGIVTLPTGTSSSMFTLAEKTALINHLTDTSSNPHQVAKADIIKPGSLITSGDIENNTITNNDLANNAVQAGKIAANAVGSAEIINNTITSDDLANDAVQAGKIAANAVGSAEIANGAIQGEDISTNVVVNGELYKKIGGTCYRIPAPNWEGTGCP